MSIHRRLVALFCGSQFISLISGEIYMVSVIWMSSSLAGKNAGYIPAMMATALLMGSMSGGILPRRWNNQDVMHGANIVRAGLIALFVVEAHIYGVSLLLLIITSALVAAATALYDPALQGLIPRIVSSPAERHTLNSLLDATKQTARILGPSIVAIGSVAVGISSFFVMSAIGFLVSAAGLRAFSEYSEGELNRPTPTLGELNFGSGIRAILSKWHMTYAVVADFVGNIGWSMGVLLGMALLYQESSHTPLFSYGLMMTSMGVGSLVSNIILARFYPKNPPIWIVTSRLIFGFGVVLLSYSTSNIYVVVVSVLMSFNGPFHRLALLNIIQSEFSGATIPAVYRLQMISMSGGLLVGYVTSPVMFATFGVHRSIFLSGLLSLSLGLLGVISIAIRRRSHIRN